MTNPPVEDEPQVFNEAEEGLDDVERSFIPWRVFVNHVDSYHGKKFAQFFPEQFYNSNKPDKAIDSADDEDEEDEQKEEEDTAGSPRLLSDEKINEEVNAGKKSNTEMVRKYEVVGTLMNNEVELNPIPEDVSMIIKREGDRNVLLTELMKCGVIVYDITQDLSQIAEARWALEAIAEQLRKFATEKPKAFKRSEEVRHFILISTVMTWALSKPLYAEDPDLAHTEEDYRKRRPHANFKEHTQCEKDVVIVKKFPELKGKLKTIVLCCGITYGDEEGPFHHLFKMAWQNAPELPIFGKGNNKIPVLHVRNLPTILLMFLRNWPKLRYIVAVEHARMSQKTIVKKISRALTTGKIKNIEPEEAFLINGITQTCYDIMTLNLNIEPAYLADQNMEWYTDLPFSENIGDIVKEYKLARNLHPVKIVVLGPPASGKSRLGKILAEHYRIHYVNVKSLITDTVNRLTNDIEAAAIGENLEKEGAETDDDDEDADVDDQEEADGIDTWRAELDEIKRNLSKNENRLDDEILNKILSKKLMSKECQNQGYVLDGYPKTLQQAKGLFGNGENQDQVYPDEEEEDEEEENASALNGKIMPELVAVLVASDEFLTERLLNLSEAEIQGTHYTEEHIIRRFREYRERNTDDDTPLQFFDEREVHPLFINVEDDPCPDMFTSFNICLKKIGRPRNYGLTTEELAELQKRTEVEAKAAEVAEIERRVVEELNRKTQREQKMMEWACASSVENTMSRLKLQKMQQQKMGREKERTNLLENLKEEEENQLCIMGEPLRHYLVKYVFPTLTQGLVNVAELRPEDPVDYLAEYLFKENPEGKMFEPDYTETMSMLLAAIEELQKDILPHEELDTGEEKYLKQARRASTEEENSDEVLVDCPHNKTNTKYKTSKVFGAESFEGESQ